MELEADRASAVSIGLIGKIRAAGGDEFGAVRQVEPVGVPLIGAARKGFRAEPVRGGSGRNREIADLAALVLESEHAGAERARQHLRPEADAKKRLLLCERDLEPVDLALEPFVRVVRAHRTAEDDNAVVPGEGFRQRLVEAWPADVEAHAHLAKRPADAPGRRMLLMQHDQNGRPTSEARHRLYLQYPPRPEAAGAAANSRLSLCNFRAERLTDDEPERADGAARLSCAGSAPPI